jgi:hypothetical protein
MYGDRLFTRDGVVYPTVIFPPSVGQEDDPDSVLSRYVPQAIKSQDAFAFYDEPHLENLQRSRWTTNGLSYILSELTEEPLTVSANLGHYFDMLATCDALDQELRAYARGERDDLPHRERLYAKIPPENTLTSGAGRCAILGGATLIVFNHDGVYKAMIAQRSSRLAVGAGLFHVMPAYVLQPHLNPPHEAEWSIWRQVLREFGEELFGMPEYADWESPVGARYFYDFPAVADLRTMLQDGRARLQLTGTAMNLMSLRMEICSTLIIFDANWYTRSEAALNKALFTERQATRYIPIDTLEGMPENLHLCMTPQGATAFWLGIDRARKEM